MKLKCNEEIKHIILLEKRSAEMESTTTEKGGVRDAGGKHCSLESEFSDRESGKGSLPQECDVVLEL